MEKVDIYLEAVRAYKNFNDIKALELFITISDYNDSTEYIDVLLKNEKNSKYKEIVYKKAVSIYEEENSKSFKRDNKYKEALNLFNSIGNYKDSQNYIDLVDKYFYEKDVQKQKQEKEIELQKIKNIEKKKKQEKIEKVIKNIKNNYEKIIKITFGIILIVTVILLTILLDSSLRKISIFMMLSSITIALYSICCNILYMVKNKNSDYAENMIGILGYVILPYALVTVPVSYVVSITSIVPVVGLILIGIPVAIVFYSLVTPVVIGLFLLYLIAFVYMGFSTMFKFINKYNETWINFLINTILFIFVILLFVVGKFVIV